jgi:hypothetical protein
MAYSIGTKFNLNDYIVEDYLCNKSKADFSVERFSFSIPPDVQSPPPPTSPQLRANIDERVAILIPDEDDDFYLNEFRDNDSDCKSPDIIEPLNDIQNILDYPKEYLLITSRYSKAFYKRPGLAAGDARYIWKQAHLPHLACVQDIEYLLLDWAFTYADLEIKDRKICGVAWLTKSECLCRASWSAFLHWILCACSTGS